DREVGGSNPLAPIITIESLRPPALAAVSLSGHKNQFYLMSRQEKLTANGKPLSFNVEYPKRPRGRKEVPSYN
ncbi:MAG TPA: hypothetical protein VD861_14010, partial [Pyrinomonadaceae bacterium]|nr:hypothetical protein [Pyrinomonadaceae bacterium]